jgi:putative hydrolase of the HAD superfamily
MIAVGFDFDHTLGIDHALEREAFYGLAKELGRPIPTDDVAHRAQIDTLLADFRAGTLTQQSMVQRFVASLFELHGTDRDDTELFRSICYTLVGSHMEPMPGARELLAHLNAVGIRTAILTNGWSPLQQKKIEATVGFQGPILVSDEIGVLKPNARAFEELAMALDTPADQIWYVGDNPAADVGGALAAGMRAAWVDHQEYPYPANLPQPTLCVTRLAELIEHFPGPIEAAEKAH